MKKMDWMIIAALLFFAALSIFAIDMYKGRPYEGRVVEIKVDGRMFESFEWTDGLEREIDIETEFGANLVSIDDSGLRMVYSNCPDQVCVRDGIIDEPGELLVCLPHRLIIEIKGKKDEDGVDDFSY